MTSIPNCGLAPLGASPYSYSAARNFSPSCREGGTSNGLQPGGAYPLQALKIQAFKSCRMNTYIAREASLKNQGLKSFEINTYKLFHPKYLWNEHLRKNPGGWGPPNRRDLAVQKEVRP